MHKIKRASFFFRILFQISFCLLPVLLILFWVIGPTSPTPPTSSSSMKFGASFIPGTIPMDAIALPLSNTTKLLGFLVSLIPALVTECTLYFLIRLFRRYEHGEIFTLQNVNYFKKIGYTLLIGEALHPIYYAILTTILSWNNPIGKRYAAISITTPNLNVIVIAFLIILISWVMAEGYKLREEQQYTV